MNASPQKLSFLEKAGYSGGEFRLYDDERKAVYFFLPAACLAATAAFVFAEATLLLLCFCVDFFWFAFGDLSPIMFCFL